MTSSSLSLDYYKILQLPKNCLQEDIAESFRNLSLKYHPKVCSPENSAKSEFHFQKLCEAYEVLSDPIKKEIYDIYGQEGLKNGIIDKKGNIKGGYIYSGNGHEIFEKFMGTANPFTLKGESEKGFFDEQICENKKNEEGVQPIDVDLECTLEELYNGCVKTVKYKKNSMSYDARTTNVVEVSQDVEIFRGYDDKTIITYKEKGNDAPGMVSSNLIIKIKELPHNTFRRINKNDLLYIHEIPLVKALNSEPVCLYTLDGRKLAISIDEIISPATVKVVPGEGMPIYDKDLSKCRGDKIKKGYLYIKFNIIFPEYIDPSKKKRIITLLQPEE